MPLKKNNQLDRAAPELEHCFIVAGEPVIASEFNRQHRVSGYTKAAAAAKRLFWLKELRRLEDKRAKKEYVSPSAYVAVYAGLQNREETLHWLDQAYRDHSHIMLHLRYEIFDFIRQDPHFDSMYRSIPLYR
jgi:succinate dehydrogenase/fumarate reductase flavoprotein subunit